MNNYSLHLLVQANVFLVLLAAHTFRAGASLDSYADGLMSACLVITCMIFFLLFLRNLYGVAKLMGGDLMSRLAPLRKQAKRQFKAAKKFCLKSFARCCRKRA